MDDEVPPFDSNNNNNSDFTSSLLNSPQLGSNYYDEEGQSNNNNFEVSDFLEFGNNNDDFWFDEYHPPTSQTTPMMIPADGFPQNPINLANAISGSSTNSGGGGNTETTRERFAFRTQSRVEILDDGFKWRKYGKKKVKNSPNPRNYYKCSVDGCRVKKRVEKDKDDPTYIITTYEGTHNHPSHGQVLDLSNTSTTA